MNSTNYYNTFIEIAEDCPLNIAEIPPLKANKKSVANLQFEMISQNPYTFTSDEILFYVFAARKGIAKNELEQEREKFFSKGQPCFRSSPLTKRYGWGIHNNDKGKMALFGIGTSEYFKFIKDEKIEKVKARRSKKA